MPRPKGSGSLKPPSYRLHRKSGLAVVTIDSKDHYLGPHGTPESHAAYDRLIAEWLSRGRRSALPPDTGPTVNDVIAQYWDFAMKYYGGEGGRRNREPEAIRLSLRPVRRLYGRIPAKDFGPLALDVVRREMLTQDLCRKEINKRVKRIVRTWKWAVSRELVPPSAHQALTAIGGLKKGKTEARESAPVRPAPEADVVACSKFVLPPVRAMIELQLLTGMRPNEVCSLRVGELDRSGPVWAYVPAEHKTDHLGRIRKIFLGPKAQAVLLPWLKADPDAYLFSPREAVRAARAARRSTRKTKVQPSQVDRSKRSPKREPGVRYTADSYRWAIKRGCKKAGVEPWHPYQLRHNAGTRLRAEFGIEVARTVLGHSSQATTEIYAEEDFSKAAEAMARVG